MKYHLLGEGFKMLHIIQCRNSCSVLTIADNGNVIEFVTLGKFWFNLVQMYDYSILPWGQNSAKFSEIKGIIRSGRSMRRQYKGQMKQTKRSKSDLRNTTQSQF